MKESVGSVALYNIIIAFLVIVFAFLAATISYSKAFRVNSRIINSLEKFEGYNSAASDEINKNLESIGYRRSTTTGSNSCPKKSGVLAKELISRNYHYCVYEINDPLPRYYHWGVLTYIYVDIPIIGNTLKIPIYTKSDSYYRFTIQYPKLD